MQENRKVMVWHSPSDIEDNTDYQQARFSGYYNRRWENTRVQAERERERERERTERKGERGEREREGERERVRGKVGGDIPSSVQTYRT